MATNTPVEPMIQDPGDLSTFAYELNSFGNKVASEIGRMGSEF